jgi:phytoene dehydrogenase-like protein
MRYGGDMKQGGKKVVIIGGGIAGLCTGVYAQKCGYQSEVLEMHDMAGGLAMSWDRGAYTFETCLHWLYGSKRGHAMHDLWQEVCEIDKLVFVHHEELVRMVTASGDSLSIPTNVDRLETELLKRSPQDAAAIRRLARDLRSLGKFEMPDPAGSWAANLMTLLGDLPQMPLVRKLLNMSGEAYGKQFKDPLIGSFFGEGDLGQILAVASLFSLAWMGSGNADYPVGGSQALIRLVEEKLLSLGGRMRFGAKVRRILVENGAAVGVELTGGETIAADWVISAADGHATIYEMLGGKYKRPETDRMYSELELFPSYLQVSLGVAQGLADQPPMLTRMLDTPFQVDPGTELNHLSFRIFNFDPTFAPAGRTAVTCFLPTRNYAYWVSLRDGNPAGYRAEKHRVAEAVIDVLALSAPGLRETIEVTDVSTPATIIRYTGNWKGTMEGWMPKAGGRMRPYPNTLPGLRRFLMVGQWISPGGGLPAGPITARPAVQAMCKQDKVAFTPR